MHNAWVCKTLPVVMTMTPIIFSNLSVMSSNWSVISSYALSVRLLSSSLDLLDDWQWQLQQTNNEVWRQLWLDLFFYLVIEWFQTSETSKRRKFVFLGSQYTYSMQELSVCCAFSNPIWEVRNSETSIFWGPNIQALTVYTPSVHWWKSNLKFM